jgi:glycosyl transferase family 25
MPEGDYDYDEAAAIIRHDRPLNTGEIGCYLSHIKALRIFLAGEAACAVVLEDDIDIPSGTFENFKAIAAKLDEFYDDKWDCVNFSSAQRLGFQDVAFIESGIEVRRSTFLHVSLPGVMWTRAGAEAYLNSIFVQKIRGPVDTEMRSHFARRGRSFVPADPMTSRLDFSSEIAVSGSRAQPKGRKGSSARSKNLRYFPDYLNVYIMLRYRRIVK